LAVLPAASIKCRSLALILTGGATEAIPVAARDRITVDFQGLGCIATQFT
jgi:2-keto-4-pentenoate hydratase